MPWQNAMSCFSPPSFSASMMSVRFSLYFGNASKPRSYARAAANAAVLSAAQTASGAWNIPRYIPRS